MQKGEIVKLLYGLRQEIDGALKVALELPDECLHSRLINITRVGSARQTYLCRECGATIERPPAAADEPEYKTLGQS